VSLRAIVKPQNALPAFAVTNQVKVCMGQQFRYRLCNRRQKLFNRILQVHSFEVKSHSRLCAENAMTDCLFKKPIQFVQRDRLFRFSRLYSFAGDLSQVACLS
jgi:hypothetical protein